MADDGKAGMIAEYLEGRQRTCVIEVWQKALGEPGRPKKWQASEIINIILSLPGWERMKSVGRFGEYGGQKGFQKVSTKPSENVNQRQPTTGKMLYDRLVSAKERELKELRDNYKPGSKLLAEKKKQAEESFNSSMARLKVRAADSALTDIEELRKQELQRVQYINEPLLAKIRAVANIPMTTLELKAFADKIGAKGDYWAGRALSDIAEQNGIDPAEIGLESTFDTKMSVLDQLTGQLNRILKYYGADDPDERANVNYMYLSDTILERAKQMYGGRIGKLSDSQKADRAYFTVRTQHTDIQKGIAISNVLRNAKGEVRNMILCRLAEDNSISGMAAEFSGHMDEIADFKNGKAAEYRAAQQALQNIRKTKNKAAIEHTAEQYEENAFFESLFENGKKQNGFLAELMHGEPEAGKASTSGGLTKEEIDAITAG